MSDAIKKFYKKNSKESLIIQFRYAKKEDLNDIWENFNEVVRSNIFIPVKREVTSDYEKNSWLINHEMEKNVVMVAVDITNGEVKEKVVGQCVIEHLTWEAAEYVGELGIIIRKGYRNIGIGKELILSAIQDAKSKGFNKINLAVFHTNLNAIHLYEKLGFKRVGLRYKQYHLKDNWYDEILMDYFIAD